MLTNENHDERVDAAGLGNGCLYLVVLVGDAPQRAGSGLFCPQVHVSETFSRQHLDQGLNCTSLGHLGLVDHVLARELRKRIRRIGLHDLVVAFVEQPHHRNDAPFGCN